MGFRSKNEDRLSNLPEEVLSHILSLMRTKLAVRTSTLSKTWRYNWTLLTNLDFDDYHPVYGLDCCSDFIDRVLKLCKTSQVTRFQLRFSTLGTRATCGSKSTSLMSQSNVSKWINEAVRLNDYELDVKVPLFEPPLSLFTCKTLTKFKLGVTKRFFDIVSSPIILPALKTLDIVVPNKPTLHAFKLIRGCPVLESLSLVISGHKDEEDYSFNIPTLKRLEITIGYCVSLSNKVFLNLPNVEYLFVGGMLSLFVMEDLSSLVEATVSLSTSKQIFDDLNVQLLKGIRGAKSLSWSSSSLDVILKSPLPKFSNLKHLELKGSFSSGCLQVFQHLESSSKLEHLCFQEPEESCWIEPQSVPTWMLTNLKTMKITRCKGRDCDLQFIEYMLANADVLKTLTITCESVRMKDEMRVCARLLTFPRAYRYCQIHFAGKWIKSTGN